jgi:murein DD-endopeptidase MepM/ murein hydrolase activator NlpD
MTAGYSWPFDTDSMTITSPYGYRDASIGSGSFHQGIDILPTGKSGAIIYAIHDGTVTISSNVAAAGWEAAGAMIIIKGTDGKMVTYEEFKAGSMKVKVGDNVKAGQPIAISGISGNSTGEHLHLGINDKGLAPLNPANWNDPTPYLGLPNKTGVFTRPKDISLPKDATGGGGGNSDNTAKKAKPFYYFPIIFK